MKSKIAAVLACLAIAFIFAAIAYPVVYSKFPHHIDRHPSTYGPSINKMVRMTVKQDVTDHRVISIGFQNITTTQVGLTNEVGREVQNYQFTVSDAQGRVAPLSPHGKRIDEDFHLWHSTSEWQTHRIAPGKSVAYRFDLTDTVDLSKLQTPPYTLAVTYAPQNNYSGTTIATTQIFLPQATSAPLAIDVLRSPVK
jgi:hypothetical protein